MSALSARLFSWVQRAPSYVGFHREAVALFPPGVGAAWLDVGCGPGLLTRLAAAHGYEALGLDADPSMIAAAHAQPHPHARFEVRALLDGAPLPAAQVVSASSLLVVLPSPRAGFDALFDAVLPGGSLLVLEATPAMSLAAANAHMQGWPTPDRALQLWATLRGGRALDLSLLPAPTHTTPLVGGLVAAHVWERAP